ncbi:histidine kinase [Sphingomonas psychrotolerans]|nr:histidine kinase dimerization/phosphoacceptor domain-containing protein [Sphingomonas psychrotolerans]
MAERERIARELHDTLIQSVQGLILRLQLIAEDLPAGQAQRAPLEDALDTVDAMLGHARDRVLNLRAAADDSADFEAMLARAAEAQDRASGPPVAVFVEGRLAAGGAVDALFSLVPFHWPPVPAGGAAP